MLVFLGCIYSGIASPTEVAVISVFYALIVSMAIYRSIKPGDLKAIMVEALRTFAPILFIFAAISESYREAGYELLGYSDQGFRVMSTNKNVREFSDFKGQKIRTMENSYHIKFWKASDEGISECVKEIEESGSMIIDLDGKTRADMIKASKPVYEEIRKNVSEKIADQYMGTN